MMICAGGAGEVQIGKPPSKLLSLRDIGSGLVQITLSYRRPDRLSAALAVVASVTWGSGKGSASVVLDVPAGGTTVSVAASDSLEVSAFAEGTDTETLVRVEAQAVGVHAAHPRPARRTTPVELNGPRVAIPSFAHAARVLLPAALEVGGVSLSLVQATGTHDDAEELSQTRLVGPSHGLAIPVVAGAEAASVTAAFAPSGASSQIPIVWELSL